MLIIISLLLYLNTGNVFPQTGSVAGVVTDSATGVPVANLSVFIPFTTTGTTTNNKGEYLLDRLPPGDYSLMFRHVSYQNQSIPITIKAGIKLVLNLPVTENTYVIDEVVKVGKIPDWRWGYNIFKEYFLGDPLEAKCVLKNPRDLKFYYEGNVLSAYAREPLEIVNQELGYRITYFLDYFKFAETNQPGRFSARGGYYAFSGSAYYEELSTLVPLRAINWRFNREAAFKGSLRHFLSSLHQGKLAENHYAVRKAYQGISDLQQTEKLGTAMAKIKLAVMDSIFSWNPEQGQKKYLYYIPDDDFTFPADHLTDGPNPGEKTVVVDEYLLVFSDFEKTPGLRDDWTYSLRVPTGDLIFDEYGNFRVPGGKLEWTNLDNSVRLKVMLPTDYLPKQKH